MTEPRIESKLPADASVLDKPTKPSTSLRPFVIGWTIYLFLVIALVGFILIPQGVDKTAADFRGLYTGGYLLRTDRGHLYDLARQKQLEDSFLGVQPSVLHFAHLAPEAILFLPFSLLRYDTAYFCMAIFNVLLIAACFFAARESFSRIFQPWQPRPGLAIFAYFPLFFVIVHGQDSLLLLLFYCLAWRQISQGRFYSAGFWARWCSSSRISRSSAAYCYRFASAGACWRDS
jgi:hypothetical protein